MAIVLGMGSGVGEDAGANPNLGRLSVDKAEEFLGELVESGMADEELEDGSDVDLTSVVVKVCLL